MTNEYVYDEYVTTIENIKESLHQNGVAILPSILNESECVHIRNGIWNFFERISKTWTIPIRRNNPTSWKEYAKLQPLHGIMRFLPDHLETNPREIMEKFDRKLQK